MHGLGPSQARALDWSTRQRVSLTQGPPGTGKTRTAVALVDAVRSKTDARILIASATNDGVDNIAASCVDKGLNIGRVGTADSISTQFKAQIAERCYFSNVEKDMEIVATDLRTI